MAAHAWRVHYRETSGWTDAFRVTASDKDEAVTKAFEELIESGVIETAEDPIELTVERAA